VDAAAPTDRFQLGLDLLQAVSDQPSVSLDLSLTGASGADAAAQTLEVRPLAGKAWQQVLGLCEFDLQATFAPGGCELSGGIVTGGAFSLTGDCDDSVMERYFSLTGTISSFGSNWDLEGTLVIDVDLLDGGVADGEVDCTVNAVRVSGSGLPAS
jgi:hypothetical protein